MLAAEARLIVETLRKGVPPARSVRQLTVGRDSEIGELSRLLQAGRPGVLLLKADWGSGKSQLLKYVREAALATDYVVSTVSVDSQSAVRFNRMDQILGAVWRGLDVNESGTPGGVGPFLDMICERIDQSVGHTFWDGLTSGGAWDYSDTLDSAAMYVALRAWYHGSAKTRHVVEDWLLQPWNYENQRKQLHEILVSDMRARFRDLRPDWQFYADEVFQFRSQGYHQSWAMLRDMHNLAQAAGRKGLIVLFDEFEDVVTNLRNVGWQQAAFWNLFQFYSGKAFNGMSFFAVTPDFVNRCKRTLQLKGVWDFDYRRFDALPTFEMSPLGAAELQELALRILEVHQIAYGWRPGPAEMARVLEFVTRMSNRAGRDRVRNLITGLVAMFDGLLEETG